MRFKVCGPTEFHRDGELWMAISRLPGGVEVPEGCPGTETGGGYNPTLGAPDPPGNPKPTPWHPSLAVANRRRLSVGRTGNSVDQHRNQTRQFHRHSVGGTCWGTDFRCSRAGDTVRGPPKLRKPVLATFWLGKGLLPTDGGFWLTAAGNRRPDGEI